MRGKAGSTFLGWSEVRPSVRSAVLAFKYKCSLTKSIRGSASAGATSTATTGRAAALLPLNECAYVEDESRPKRSLSLCATRLNYINPIHVSQKSSEA